MNPFYSDSTPQYPYSPLNNYAWNIHQQPTIERYRNQINYGWQNMSHGGLNHSHFSYGDPTHPYGWGFLNDGAPAANFSLYRTARQGNPFVAPGFQDDDGSAASFLQHQTGRPINTFATSPARPTNRVASPRARPTNPVIAPRARPFWCKICEVRLSSSKNIEQHYKGRNHQNMLKRRKHTLKRYEKSEELRGIRRREREQVPNALGNRKIYVERHKDYLGKSMVETSIVPAENVEGERRDNSVTRGYDSKRKIGGTNGGNDENKIKRIRRTTETSKCEGELRDKSVAEGCASKQKFRESGGCNNKDNTKQLRRDVASSKPEGELRHNSVAEGHDSKLKIGGTSGGNDEKIKQRRVIKSSKSDTNAPSSGTGAESTPQVSTVAPREQPMPLQVLLPVPAVGSNSEPQIQPLVLAKSEANVNHKSFIPTNEKSVQLPSSMSVKLDALVNSSTNNGISNGSCEVEEKTEVLDVSPLSMYVEPTVQVPTAAPSQKTTPLKELSLLPPEGSNFELLIQPFIQVELEHQVSEDNAHYESQNPIDETNVYLPSSISMEFDAPANSSTSTEISNENSITEENMEVTTKLRKASIDQENVCFVCGDRGFEEALVYCNKCEIWARHRYCLDGPVIFTKEVTWFCEDCEPIVETCDSQHLEDAIHTKMEKTNFTRQLEERNEFKKECQESKDHAIAQPIDYPSWSGSLHLCNKSIGRFFAHLSDLACPLVSEETRRFPEKLSMDLLQRCVVWPNHFLKYGTDHDSIALYFFPDERSEREYDKLVDDLVHSDLAMRAVLEHVELLVFPSTVLPIEYRRFKAKCYLWGVFKAKKT